MSINQSNQADVQAAIEDKLARTKAVKAYDAMVAARPLHPPTRKRPEIVPRRIGEIELEQERRAGILCDGPRWDL